MFFIGNCAFIWNSKKQDVMALSNTKVKYITVSECTTQVVWLRKLLEEFDHLQIGATKVYCDNNSAIAIAKNMVFHEKCKHIHIRYYFIQELIMTSSYCIIKVKIKLLISSPKH